MGLSVLNTGPTDTQGEKVSEEKTQLKGWIVVWASTIGWFHFIMKPGNELG
jgi:hypothetical protein